MLPMKRKDSTTEPQTKVRCAQVGNKISKLVNMSLACEHVKYEAPMTAGDDTWRLHLQTRVCCGVPALRRSWRSSGGLARDSPGDSPEPPQWLLYFKQMSNTVHFNAYKFKSKYVLNIVFNSGLKSAAVCLVHICARGTSFSAV